MYVEFNSVTLFTFPYSRFQNSANDVSQVHCKAYPFRFFFFTKLDRAPVTLDLKVCDNGLQNLSCPYLSKYEVKEVQTLAGMFFGDVVVQ